MILPQDLRIGNKVYWDKEKGYTYTINMGDFSSLDVFDKIEPIPITPDILVKCGFVKEQLEMDTDEGGHYYSMRLSEDKYVDLSILSGDKNETFEVFLFPYDTIRYQYLHQIQNLFQSITGKELMANIDAIKINKK